MDFANPLSVRLNANPSKKRKIAVVQIDEATGEAGLSTYLYCKDGASTVV
jgi:hypothetical protein